ncbi:amino acid adenylation domain-containing protein [Pseudomonas sp. S75]|uniref:amino acid adenylation domain-containing protein n=1 Tax=unclassified Pseudomonas TaxID=196821 RepID=UPI001903A708|nr:MULTISPECIES: non-ribosomal peptide synthetase [unclassified Pseudomonas]MBJ9978440.1 amino acid adenylation domain-containing protein [Pseudomonas sp. S30]MBK0152262.1 amino acid adenylation domain-containing protein [Pseudomonas sp. S75]
MDKSTAERIARRFVGLALEQRRQILDKMHETGQSFRLLPIAETRHDTARIPLSYAQQRMLFLWQLEPHSSFYNVPMAVRLSGPLNQTALEGALQALVQRHESLRTRFVSEDGEFHQQVLEQAPLDLQLIEVRAQAGEDREQCLDREVCQALEAPFDLLEGPLLRVRLLRVAPDEHVLTVCLHHIVSDGWSGELMVQEFIQFYEALSEGRDPQLPPLAVQYADYAIWQRAWLEAGEGERQLQYWREQLGDEHPLLELPLDHPRPAQPSYRGATLRCDVPPALSAQLKAQARTSGHTLFMITLAALAVVLSRYSGQADVRVGAPNAGRNRKEVQGLIGFFINTQVLRVQVDERQSGAALLEQVRQVVSGAQSHQELPFEHLVDALAPERSLGHNPLFQVKLNQNLNDTEEAEQSRQKLGELTVGGYPLVSRDARFDLAYDFSETPDGLLGYFTYSTDLFEASTIARLASSLLAVLQTLAAHPDAPLLAHPDPQAVQLDGTARTWPCPDFLSLWRNALARGDERPALRVGETVLSYAELERRSNRFAHYLGEQGVRAGATVALCQERTADWVTSLLAVLKLGAAYLPLDGRQPSERLQHVLRSSGACLLVHAPGDDQAAALGMCPALACDAAQYATFSEQAPAVSLLPGQPAYLIYTSGSTGQPKGVVVSHGALANYLQGVLERLALSADASLAMVSTVAADLGHTVLFGALASGRELHLLSHDQGFDPDAFARYMDAHQVDVLKIVPSHLQGLLQAADPARVLPRELLILGGEASSWALIEQVRRLRPGCRIVNHYGPTETTVGVLTQEVREQAGHWRSVPVGRPLDNAHVRVLDAYLNPLPEGVAGELYLGGASLAQGYVGQPGLTAERFVPDPQALHGERLYRAGDRARLQTGVLEYLGRGDDQVKIRGYRVEPGEISQLLRGLDGVQDAVVLAVPLDSDAERLQLLAWVVAAQGVTLDAEALRQTLQARLPDYMVPAQILLLDQLPLTANGKLDKRALPRPDAVQQRYTAPAGEVEQILAKIWEEVLKRERIGSTDNFFELGGDSILSLQIIARAKRQGLKLSPKQLFEQQTVGQLAAVAKRIEAKPARPTRERVAGQLKLLPIQARFFATDIPQRQHWNQAVLLTPRQPLGTAQLRTALTALVDQHDALRLRFLQTQAGWYGEYAELDLSQVLWHHRLDDASRIAELADEAQRSLDLGQGPLMRVVLIDLPAGQQRLLLVIHHLVVDGVSWRVLLEDLQSACQSAAAGSAPALATRSSSLQAWSEHLHAHARSPALQAELDYWQAQLHGMSDALPWDNPHGGQQRRHEVSVRTELDAELTRQLLQQAPAAYRTQVNDLLLTALAQVICRWTGQADALIRLEGHGREDLFDDLDITRTVGWFSTLYPLKLTPAAQPGESLMAIKEQLRAVPNKGIGYGLLRYLGDDSARQCLGALPQGNIVFNYLGQFDASFDSEAGLFTPAPEGTGHGQSAEAPLGSAISIDGQVYAGRLTLDWSFSRERFDPTRMQGLADEYAQALRELIAHCLQPESAGVTPSDFPLARLDSGQLAGLPIPAQNIEDIYPLSPMQQGMLFHSLSADASLQPGQTSHYVNQLRLNVQGLDPSRFISAWQATLDQHPILRSSFFSQFDTALQVVQRHVDLPVTELDWRGRADRDRLLDDWAEADLARGFELSEAPLLRLALIRTDEREHQLVFTNHHILLDGWSSSRLFGEVLQRYAGHAPATPARRYRDYIQWLQAQDAQASERFWRERTAELDEPTRLAQALKCDATLAGQGECNVVLDALRTERLADFAREQRVTLNTLVQATWLLLLQRYTGQACVAFGATVAGRPAELPGIEEQLGLFINTLPVVASPRPEQHVADWVQQVQALNLALREHEHAPLYEIQRWAGRSGEPLFDNILVFENYPVSEALQEGAPQELVFGELLTQEQTNYPLTLVAQVGERLLASFKFDRAQFAQGVVERMAGHFVELLEGLAKAPQRSLGELVWAQTEVQEVGQYPSDTSLHEQIEAQAARAPQAIALSFAGESLSYGDLNSRANCLAHKLREQGVGPDVLVGLAVERGFEMIVGLLAILKAGGAYVPLDPEYPQDRLSYMIEDSGIALLVTQQHLLHDLPVPSSVRSVVLDDALEGYSDENPEHLTQPGNLAYVIYTSGSTGKPKGTLLPHHNVLRLFKATEAWFGFDESDVWTLFHSYAFDFSVWEIFGALLHGGRLVIVPRDVTRSPEDFHQLLVEQGVTVLNQTPSAFKPLMRIACNSDADLALRQVIFGGEALDVAALQPWFERFGQECDTLTNMYGITETTVHVTYRPIRYADTLHSGSPIGAAIPDLSMYVLDADFNPVAPGCNGELHVGHAGLARGYHNRPSLTAERFVPDPFSAEGGRLYRTGDLARYRSQDVIEYVGRIDHQVKIRGFRIELGEIEARLQAHAGVREVLVLDIDGAGGKQLVAYLIPQDAQANHAQLRDELRQHLKAQLPDYMVPTHFVLLDHWPLTANGKLDRKSLPKPDASQLQQGYVAPRTPLEQQLAAIWSEVLDVEQVGLHDNFFELGGHSLLVITLVNKLRATFSVQISLHEFMLMPNFEALASFIGGGNDRLSSPVVALNACKLDRPALFCLPPGGGAAYAYYPLASRLAAQRPVYGVVNKSYAVPGWVDQSWEEMVGYYVEQIRATQAQGPYHVLGWSLGGALALEVAHRLEQMGQQVGFVGLVDSLLPADVSGLEDNPTVLTEPVVQAADESLLRALLAFAPGVGESRIMALISEAHTLPVEVDRAEWVIERVAALGEVSAEQLREIHRDVNLQQDIVDGFALLEHNSTLSQAFRLRPLQVQVDCWWASQTRSAERVAKGEAGLLAQASVNGLASSTVIADGHEGIVNAPEFVEGVVERLAQLP